MKELVKKLIPRRILEARAKYINRKRQQTFEGLSPKMAFTRIYQEGLWGRTDDPNDPYCSGTGSHEESIVSVYAEAVAAHLGSFVEKPNVVDLGCGDFAVGSKVRHLAQQYIACDVVDPLIARNRVKFASMDVDFRVLDMVAEDLPPGDIVFVRQVFQHLSNAQIARVVPKLRARYKQLVLSEHLPLDATFTPNQDKPVGPDIRVGSGVVLTAPPFDLRPQSERVLCEAREVNGVVRTTLFVL